jgi:hypothetical protein
MFVLVTSASSVPTAVIQAQFPEERTFNFLQEGYGNGGTLARAFRGTDTNGDGILSGQELSQFTITFAGDTVVHDFNATYSSRDFLEPIIIGGKPMENQFNYSLIEGTWDFATGKTIVAADHEWEAWIHYQWRFNVFGERESRGVIIDAITEQELTLSTTSMQLVEVPEPSSGVLAFIGVGALKKTVDHQVPQERLAKLAAKLLCKSTAHCREIDECTTVEITKRLTQ